MIRHWLYIGILHHMLGGHVGAVGVAICVEKCVWNVWALPWYTPEWKRVSQHSRSTNINSCQGILSLPNLWRRCGFHGAFWGGGRHVLFQQILRRNNPRIVWVILVARHVFRDREWGCFVYISFHWDVFLEALGRGCLRAVGCTFPCEFLCRRSHILWPLLGDCNFWLNLLAGRWVSFSYTLGIPFSCWGSITLCKWSWTWRKGWSQYC